MKLTRNLNKWLSMLLLTLFVVGGLSTVWADDPVPDPNGGNTGNAGNVTAAKPGEPTMAELAAEVGHSKVAINMVWTLLTGFIVMFMQAGFALVETALCRAENSAHTMTMNFLIYPLRLLGVDR